MRTRIAGTGSYVPDRVITNQDLTQWMDTSDEWIRQRTGIEKRHWLDPKNGLGVSDMALEASKKALERSGWKAEDLDFIIFATITPDYAFPGSGCILQEKLGLDTTPSLDIRQQCSSFIYGLSIADAYIRSGTYKKILFVGSEAHSYALDISTEGRDLSVLFGDAASAVCMEAIDTEEEVGILGSSLHTQGKYAKQLFCEAPTYRQSPAITAEMMRDKRHFPKMEGSVVFKHATRRLLEAAEETLKKSNLKVEDLDLVIPHQANLRICQLFQKSLSIAPEKVFNNIQKYGNTTAASIPLALDEAIRTEKIKPKSTLLFVAFGSGFTWGGLAYRDP